MSGEPVQAGCCSGSAQANLGPVVPPPFRRAFSQGITAWDGGMNPITELRHRSEQIGLISSLVMGTATISGRPTWI
jgi:hypothetical protein